MRSVHSRKRAPAKLISTATDFRALVAKAPHLTIPRQRTLVYGGKLLFSNAEAKIPKAISQKGHDGFSFLNDENLDECLTDSQQEADPSRHTRTLVVEPALSQMYDQSYPRRSPSKRQAKTTALIRWHPVTWVYLDRNFSDCSVR